MEETPLRVQVLCLGTGPQQRSFLRLNALHTQSSEPILFPKLRIYFAEFPKWLSSSWPEAANLRDLMRLWYDFEWIRVELGFSLIVANAPPAQKRTALPDLRPYLWIIQFHGFYRLRRKENSSRGTRRCLRGCLCCHTGSIANLRNINLIPFRHRSGTLLRSVSALP